MVGRNFSSVGHFLTPPAVEPTSSVYVLDTADMGHAEPDGSNEWEDDHNERLYNAPGALLLPCSQQHVYSSWISNQVHLAMACSRQHAMLVH